MEALGMQAVAFPHLWICILASQDLPYLSAIF